MRVEYESRVECAIMASKIRVAPLDKQTIPRLELLSNLTASRLVKSVNQALENVVKVNDVVNWTDSMISLWWIRNADKNTRNLWRIGWARSDEIHHLSNGVTVLHQNRNTDFPVTFVENAEQEHVSEH